MRIFLVLPLSQKRRDRTCAGKHCDRSEAVGKVLITREIVTRIAGRRGLHTSNKADPSDTLGGQQII